MFTMLLVDDEYLVRMGVRETIEWEQYGIEIIGEAPNGEEGLALALRYMPDIILTDIRMPKMDGTEFMQKLRENNLESKIIVLSGFEDFDYARNAIHSGAMAYLLKPIDNEELIQTMQRVVSEINKERKTNHYFNQLKNELSAIKKQFLLDLIGGTIIHKPEIEEKLEFLQMPIKMTDNYVVVIRIDDYEAISKSLLDKDLALLKEATFKESMSFILNSPDSNGVFFDKSEDEWVILLHEDHEGEMIESLKVRCKEFVQSIKNQFSPALSIGISDKCTSLEYIQNAYKEAYLASTCKLIPKFSSVVFIKEMDVTNYRREIIEAMKYIKEHYSKEITIEDLANELFISPSHLMHLFKREVGKTLNECLTDYRMEIAKELLKDSKLKIYEISENVGYRDVKYFSQIFKRTIGMTPSDYIKSQT